MTPSLVSVGSLALEPSTYFDRDFVATGLHKKDVFRLQIAVNDAVFVSFSKTFQDLKRDFDRFVVPYGPVLQNPIAQINAIEELHDDVEEPGDLTKIEKLDRVWMAQVAGVKHFASKTFDLCALLGSLGLQDFERDIASHHVLTCTVDHAIAAASQFIEDTIASGDKIPDFRQLFGHLLELPE